MNDEPQQKHTHRYSLTDDLRPSQATYLAVAEAKDCDPLDLPPIAKAIDAEGLDDFVSNSNNITELLATFEYADRMVTITPEEVRVETL